MLPVIALYVYLASVGINLLSGNSDPKQIIASVIGLITAVMAIAYTTKLMYDTLFSKSVKSKSNLSPQQVEERKREKARR